MPSHRTPTVFLLPVLLAGGACTGIASAQVTFEFTNSGQALGNGDSWSVALGDLDADGDLDAMVANEFGQPNTVWTNDGNGTFTNSGQALGNGNSYSVALGDFDGDGDLDAMVANGGPNTVWLNQQQQNICAADITGDGEVDGQDLAHLLSRWGTSNSGADLNSDGVVNGADLTEVLSGWGICE